MKSSFDDDELSGSEFLKSKEMVFIIYPLISFVIILSLYMWVVYFPEQDLQSQKEKALINSLSCIKLGEWIINNSDKGTYLDSEKNYVYAQAKYLVCTHTGVSP